MGGVSSQGDNKLNTDLNLVPFIDLLSTLVLFLLVTTVWLQIAVIPTAVDTKGKSAAVASPKTQLSVRLSTNGHQITWPGGKGNQSVGKKQKGYDYDRLKSVVLTILKTAKTDSAAVTADDSVDYGSVIQTIDELKLAGLTSVALGTD